MHSVLEGVWHLKLQYLRRTRVVTKGTKWTIIMIYLTACFIPDQVMFQLNKVAANGITVVKLLH